MENRQCHRWWAKHCDKEKHWAKSISVKIKIPTRVLYWYLFWQANTLQTRFFFKNKSCIVYLWPFLKTFFNYNVRVWNRFTLLRSNCTILRRILVYWNVWECAEYRHRMETYSRWAWHILGVVHQQYGSRVISKRFPQQFSNSIFWHPYSSNLKPLNIFGVWVY